MSRSLVLALALCGLITQGCGGRNSHARHLRRLYRATRHLDASVSTGTTYNQYSAEVADAFAAFLIAQDHAQGSDKVLLDEYRPLLQKHQDALYIWGLDINRGKGDESRLIQIEQTYGMHPEDSSGDMFSYFRNLLWLKTAEDEKKIIPELLGATNR
jgi:hypothetical protein